MSMLSYYSFVKKLVSGSPVLKSQPCVQVFSLYIFLSGKDLMCEGSKASITKDMPLLFVASVQWCVKLPCFILFSLLIISSLARFG